MKVPEKIKREVSELRRQIEHELARRNIVDQQIRDIENERARLIRSSPAENVEKVRQLSALRGIGANSAWLYVMEIFGWRKIRNRRQLGSLAGLTPTPHDSGAMRREQGISKAGNARVRQRLIELAWLWLRIQPRSDTTLWFQRRYGQASRRMRRVGIVGVARKLLIELWRFVEHGVLPPGAQLKPLTSPSR